MDIREWTLHLRVVTPMAMSGADQGKAEWRAASVKGLIRWWFRVAGGSREDEDRLFGAVHGDTPQASILKVQTLPPSSQTSTAIPAPYFGFSIRMNRRPTIPEGTSLKVRFQVEPWADDKDVELIRAAIGLSFYLGNFGTRARKGYGSLIVERVDPPEFQERFPALTSSADFQRLYSQILPKYLDLLRGPSLRIDGVLYTSKPWQTLEQSYRTFRKDLGVPDKALLGYPFHPSETGGRHWPERHASPLIIKPLREEGPCIVTVLLVPDDVRQKFSGPPSPNLAQYYKKLKQFLISIQARPLWTKGKASP